MVSTIITVLFSFLIIFVVLRTAYRMFEKNSTPIIPIHRSIM
ncbi:hypothetical protein SAMN05421677_105166 [Halobacillus aidingensis]|uniref:Uncharacterized protein n=1 Tax=Halobacillus aidingensis TaxID=240303 RepID=A0A1H0JXR7_HALAD|nr:hypothetical protein SAMN05421677_105166 [Halobacillus aidingensis]